MALVSAAKLNGSSVRLTDGNYSEAAAAWFPTQLNVQGFSTDFTFQQKDGTVPIGDGLTFAIQGVGTTAIGPNGGGLGYGALIAGGTGGIPKSVAVKFDLFQNAHEGNNSTGLYTNGASPEDGATTLGGGVNLQTADIFAVHISYDGSTLTMTITDTVDNTKTFTKSWPINIPATVGGSTAWVGFTGGTAHYTAVQDIFNWTYVSTTSGGQQTAATPVISPTTGTYAPPQTVSITDATSGATIFYTLDGSQPTTSSTKYAGSFTVSSTTTVKAMATAPNFLQSATATSVITISQSQTSTPLISPSTGTYSSPQTVNITDATSGSTIYYTLDGSQPTTSSTQYTSAFTVSSTTTVKAIATAPNFTQSNAASSVITIQTGGGSTSINFASGFTAAGLQFNGRTKLNGTRLRLTDGGQSEASSAWFTSPVNVQTFTTDFSFQLTTPNADGMTFAIQNAGATALGPSGGGLGYGAGLPGGTGGIPTSIAVKFDLFQNSHEGNNSTGLYTNGTSPTSPAITLGGGVNLHSGDIFQVHMTYDGTTLTMTITDTVTKSTFTNSWTVDIPGTIGSTSALAGFTAGTGGQTATQEIISWTYSSNASSQPAATPVISPATGTYTSTQAVTITDATAGTTIYYTVDGSQPTTSSTQYTASFPVSTTTTVKAIATAPNFAPSSTATSVITIQSGSTAINFASGFTAAGLQSNGRTRLNGTRLRLTDGGQSEASSAWFTTPVNVQSFTTDFSFQLTNPNADGMTFAIQNVGLTALGPAGGGLGYGAQLPGGTPGIATSVAVKFDLFQNSHEGNNSTGLYTNGASPTSPAITLGGVNLHSGDVFQVHMTYDGTTLTMTITDTVTNATFTNSWAINIPATVGGNTALVGFTAGTGGQTATQEIITWTYGS
jgi:hypothetical protein